MFKRMVNLPFKVLSKAARAVQQREDSAMRARLVEAEVSDADSELRHTPKFDVPDDYEPDHIRKNTGEILADQATGSTEFVDVRAERTEQIPETQHLPLRTLDIRLAELPPAGTRIIVYCDDEELSLLACRFLRFRGIEEVFLLEGGLHAWREAEGPLEPVS